MEFNRSAWGCCTPIIHGFCLIFILLCRPSSLFTLTVTFLSLVGLTIFLLGFAVGLLLSGGAANTATVTLTMETALANIKLKMTLFALYFT